MFETFLNAILISIMISVKCDTPFVIREDRVYRYVGNGSDQLFQSNFSNEEIGQNFETNQNHSTHHSIISEGENIPESLLIQMKDISSASDFISSFLMADNDPKNKDIYLSYLERGFSENQTKNDIDINEERTKLTKLPKIGRPAGCIPEMKIIELNPTNTHNELYFPSCIRISRCSGCCPSQRLHCVPISTSLEDITVIRVKYSPIEKRLKFEGFKVFRIEKHDKCKCDCIQKSNNCFPNQTYSESECRCICADTSAANDCKNDINKYWDHNECNCKCKSVPFCSTGLFFNHNTCRCESEEEVPNASHFTAHSISLDVHRYVVDKRINSEIDVQNNKGLDIFKVKGINPDIDEEFHGNSDS